MEALVTGTGASGAAACAELRVPYDGGHPGADVGVNTILAA